MAGSLFLFSHVAAAGSGGPDNFGYTWLDSDHPQGPDYQWIDVSQSGQTVVTGSSVAGRVILEPPAVIYGGVMKEIVVSRHGYISNVVEDTGTDSTNDCGLPVDPGGVPVGVDRPHRIYVTHDELEFDPNGSVLHEFFPNSPHPQHPGGVHVITWKDVRHPSDPFRAKFSMQVLLFSNFDIVMQFQGGGINLNDGASSTTGIQQNTLEAGLQVACNTPGTISGNMAILFRPPVAVVTTASDQNNSPAGAQLSLREALRDSLGGTRIEFAPSLDGEILLLDETLLVTGAAIGSAKAVSIDAGAGDRIILVAPLSSVGVGANSIIRDTAPLLHLYNLHLLNSDLGNMAAGVNVIANRDLIADDCRFDHHQLHAIRVGGGDADLIDCEFVSNRASASPGASRFGGAVTSGKIRATACLFDSNEIARLPNAAEEARGGAVNCGIGTFVDCVFRANKAGSGGGAIYGDTINVTGCEFVSNLVDNGLGRGGAVESLIRTEARSTIFERNAGGLLGGAIYNHGGTSGEASVVNCAFGSNEALLGGAIALADGSITMELSTLRSNTGPAVYLPTAADGGEVVNCAFEKNLTDAGVTSSMLILAGGVTPTNSNNVFDDAPAGFTGTETLLNTAARLSSSRFYIPYSDSPLINSGAVPFDGDPALDIRGYPRVAGGRVDIGCYESVDHVVVTTAVDENVAPGTGTSLREALAEVIEGGVVSFKSTLDGAVINAVAEHEIGVGVELLADDLPNGITIDASGLGLGVRLLTGAKISGVDVRGATVGIDAGADTDVTGSEISDCATGLLVRANRGVGPFVGNELKVTDCGGVGTTAVLLEGALTADFTHSEFSDNSSSGVNGGAIRGGDDVVLTAASCEFLRNEAQTGRGGAIYLEGNARLEMASSAVLDNVASQSHGGGIYLGDNADVLIRSVTIARNRSGGDGGGLHLAGEADLNVTGSTISQNVAGRSGVVCRGGAIYSANSDLLTIRASTIVGNDALTSGGGLAFGAGDTVTLEQTILAGNTSGAAGNINNLGAGFTVNSVGGNLTDNAGLIADGNLINTAPLLGPLGYYGPSQGIKRPVHAPLAISPAIDATSNGVGSVSNIGAVEGGILSTTRIVTSAADSGAGSLREAIATTSAYDRILFAPELNGAILTLSQTLTINSSVQIDATTLPRGITLSGGDSVRVLDIDGEAQVAMHAVSITGGNRALGGATNWGSAVRLQGDATLTFSHGAMYGNETAAAGTIALRDRSELVLSNATIAENFAGGGGSAIQMQPDARARIEHSTIANNHSGLSGPALGISTGRVVAYSSIIANNRHTTGLSNFSTGNASDPFSVIFKSLGYNLTDPFQGAVIEAGLNALGDLRTADLSSADLIFGGQHSGWSPTVQTAATGAINHGDPRRRYVPIFDGRGKARVAEGRIDIGPLEEDGEIWDTDSDGMPDWWENLYALRLNFGSDADDDPDGDRFDNLAEFQNGTNPRVADSNQSAFRVTALEPGPAPGSIKVFYESDFPLTIVIERSDDLVDWRPYSQWNAPGGSGVNTLHPNPGIVPTRRFYRFLVQ